MKIMLFAGVSEEYGSWTVTVSGGGEVLSIPFSAD